MINNTGKVFAEAFVTAFKEWDESQHPRNPSGSDAGGEFANAGGASSSDAPADTPTIDNRTPQEKLQAKMEAMKIPYREINVYGSQITVETASESAAKRWASVVRKFARVNRILKTTAYAKKHDPKNFRMIQMVDVWRVYATV